jgi:hypothetical protein
MAAVRNGDVVLMWSIPLCYCNNGNNNRTVKQLQYYINYTIEGGGGGSVLNFLVVCSWSHGLKMAS